MNIVNCDLIYKDGSADSGNGMGVECGPNQSSQDCPASSSNAGSDKRFRGERGSDRDKPSKCRVREAIQRRKRERRQATDGQEK